MPRPSPPRSWFERDAPVVAVDLLGKLLVVEREGKQASGRIVETEAYMADDPASHSYRGRTGRNAVMFGPAGHLYVYRSYGIHWCANVVTGAEGEGQAVLIRAIEPVEGIDEMLRRRGRHPLADGPGKLCQALGIDGAHDGVDLVVPGAAVRIVDEGSPPPADPVVGPRIGISRAIDRPWRWRAPRGRTDQGP
jgi:DNA-3-methyladenine glycosylase